MTNLDELKKGLNDEINQRVKDRILEPANAELLIKLINNAENETEAISIAELGTTYKRTGFHFNKKLEKIGQYIKYKKKNEKLSFTNDENRLTHELIIGDNYDALLNLMVNLKNKIDVIYIDPPYGKNDMGEFANTNYVNFITRDNLLSMLYPRLLLAKKLLNDEGIIICSIDDKNQAYVKGIMDEIFNENNFVACCPRKSAGSRTTKSMNQLQVLHDYILIYRAPNNKALLQNVVGEKKYPFNDKRGKYYVVPLQDNGPHGTQKQRPNLYYPIYQKTDGSLTLEETDKKYLPHSHKGENGCWMWSKKKFENDKNDLTINKGEVKIKHYYVENEDINKYQAYKSWLDQFLNKNGTKTLKSIVNTSNFANPKPVELIEYFINLCPKKDAIVLDFFAGSGTTGHAVMSLNHKDNGNRRFICVTNNEITEDNPNGIAIDITSKRLKRIMSGKCYDGSKNFEWLEKNEPFMDNLNVYEIEKVSNSEQRDGQNPFDVIDETCYGIKKFNSIDEKISWICSKFENCQKYIEE